MAIAERVIGTVARFDPFSGTGTIVLVDGREALLHYAAIRGEGIRRLEEGTTVSCQVEETRRGWSAVCVEQA